MSRQEQIEKILLRYPAIRLEQLPDDKLKFIGNVRVQNQCYRIHVLCPDFPSLKGVQLRLQQAMRVAHYTAESANFEKNAVFDDLIAQLPRLMPPLCVSNGALPNIPNPANNIYAEIAALQCPSAYTIHINDTCTRIRFSKFAQFEQHYLEVELPSLQLLSHSLPNCVPWAELLAKVGTLTLLLQQFLKYLDELRGFYEQLNDIDEMCYVVQPLKPGTKENNRMFLLRERVFLNLTIRDPFAPIASMTISIVGPTYEVEKLRLRYSEGIKDWDADLDIHKNLLRIFDLCFFPMPPGSDTSVLGEEGVAAPEYCSICYCNEMDDQVPVVSCDNKACTAIFHAGCLRKWFNTLSDGKVFLEVSFGICPFCKSKLSTSFADLLSE